MTDTEAAATLAALRDIESTADVRSITTRLQSRQA